MPVDWVSPLFLWIVGVVAIYMRIARGPSGERSKASNSPLKMSTVLLPTLIGSVAWFVVLVSASFIVERQFWPAIASLVVAVAVMGLIWASARGRTVSGDG